MFGVHEVAFRSPPGNCDDRGIVRSLVQSSEFAEFPVRIEPLEGCREFHKRKGEPEVFADLLRYGLFAEEGELFEGSMVL